MSEVLRDLVVSLSLDGDNFSRNLTSINKQIQEAESEFRRAAAGVDNFEKSAKGLAAQSASLQQKFTLQQKAVTQYERALEAANKKLETAHLRQGKLTASLAEASTRNGDLKTKVAAATKQYEAFQRELGDTDSATIAAKANLDALSQEYAESSAEVKKLEGQLAANTKSLQNNADAVTKARTNLNQAQAALKQTEAQIKATTDKLARLQSTWTKTGDTLSVFGTKCAAVSTAMSKVGKGMTAALTTPVLALGTAAIKASVDFESAFTGVRKTVDATEQEYERLSDAVKKMSTEVATSSGTIAEVMANAGQLGIQNDYLVEFTRTMIDLGNSTDIAANEAATAIAQFGNVTNMAQADIGRFGAALVDLGNNYATTESAIMHMATRLAAAGSQVGLSQSQILGFATALSSVGLEAEAGGTAFSKAMIQMQVAVETGNDSLADFARVSGLTKQAFKDLWNSNPAGAIEAFIVGLSRMDEQGVSSIATLEEMGLKEVRLRDTLMRATNATKLFASAQKTANKAWTENTALTSEADKRYATMESRLKNLKNTAVLAAQRIGDDLTPTIRRLIDGANGLLEKFMALDEKQRLMIIKFAAIAAAAGPAILAFSKVVKVVGIVSTGFGKFALSVGKAGGGWKGFLSVLGKSPAVWLAVGAAVVVATKALYDYATGATQAREALEGMNRTADKWASHAAESIYNNEGLASFGLSKDDFKGAFALKSASAWKDGLIRVWTDGQKETKEIVTEWTDSFKALNVGMTESLQKLKSDATATGHSEVADTIQKDIDALAAMDAEVEKLLKKRQKGLLSEKDKLRLDGLIDAREAIQVKYILVPDGENGYAQILQGIETEKAKAQARGQKYVDNAVYERGLTSTAQGYAAVTAAIDERYDAEYKVIQLMAEGSDKTAAQAALDAQYNADRKAAAQEYADVLKQIVLPVWHEDGIQQASADMDKLMQLFREYSTIGGDGYQDPALLTQMDALTSGMNEDDLVSYIGLLQQVQSLLDGGMSEAEVQAMFPEFDFSQNLDELAALADFASQRSGELEGLSKILNEMIPEEMQKLAVDLDLTLAQQRWAEFAANPGVITTDAVIGNYAQAEEAPVPQPIVDALVQSYSEIENGASTVQLSPNDVVAEVASYLEAEGANISALKPDQVEAIVNAYAEATGCDKSALLQAFTAYITAYDDTKAVKPTLSIKVSITGYDLAAYNEFVRNNPVEVEGRVRLGEVYRNPLDVLNAPGAKFYQNGQEIPVGVVPKEKLTADTLFVLAADGTMHVLITPVVEGTAESMQAANDLLKSTEHQGSLGAKLFGDDTLADIQRLNEYLTGINNEMNSWLNFGGWMDGWDRSAAAGTISNYLDATEIGNIQAVVNEAIKALNNGETLSEEMIANLQSISNLVNLMDSIGVGENILAGIAEGMTQAGTDTSAETVAANLEAALNAALGIQSPSTRMKPVGENVAAGVGEGMAGYDLSSDAATLANGVAAAVGAALTGDALSAVGTAAASGLASAMSSYSMAATGSTVSANVKGAVSGSLNLTTLRAVGVNAMAGLTAGINAGRLGVIAAMRAAARAAVNAAKAELRIASPSGVFRDEVGRMAMKGLGQGAILESKAQAKVIRNAARFLSGEAQAGFGGSASFDNRKTYNQNSTSTINVEKLYVRDEQDIRSLAIEIASLTKRQQRGRGLRMA
ncbi:MAG: phage tail tape measure protein [Christensenellaceae bacterium]|nr:phage tail tape measure protein [Christensenellaceae bacterium]